MICKLIGHASTRPKAIDAVLKALRSFKIEGVKTTIPLHIAILDTPEFRKGDYDTRLVQEFLAGKTGGAGKTGK